MEEQKGKEGKKKDRKRRNEERKRGKRKSAFQWSELVGPRSKVHIFDEEYTPRGSDSSYFGLFSTIRAWGCVFALRGCLTEF